MKAQAHSAHSWILRRAIAVSILLNATMALCGTLANLVQPLHWLSFISSAIAFPPSLILRHLASLNGNSLARVIAIEIEGIVFSLVFYGALAAVVLWLMSRHADKAR